MRAQLQSCQLGMYGSIKAHAMPILSLFEHSLALRYKVANQIFLKWCGFFSGGRETIPHADICPKPQIPSNSYKSITRAKLKIIQLNQLIRDRIA